MITEAGSLLSASDLNKINYIFVLLFFSVSLLSQDLEKISKEPVKVTGGLNLSSVYYNANGIPPRRQPFTYFVNGNIAANVTGINLPFTFNYSNNQVTYTQPYNIQSFNPSYKWIKGYAGIISMNFSPYTVAGHIFAGGGIELSPKNFRFAALYGRFKKPTEYDFEKNSDANMAYKRLGWGASAGYEKGPHSIKLIYFSAKDDPASLSFIPVNTYITPMENTVLSFAARTSIFKRFSLQGEYALSALTRDITSPNEINSPPRNQMPLLFNPNATSQFFRAYKGGFGYRYQMFAVNFNYERVGPDFKTLGAYYFNNDLENITIAPSLTLLQGKLNLSANTGIQRNNLNGSKLNTTKRWVGALNFSYSPNQHWNFSGSYSNFSSYTKQRPQSDPFYKNTLDTLNFYQLTQNGMLSANYNFGGNDIKQNIIMMGSYMVTGQKQGAIAEPGVFGISGTTPLPDQVINGNLAHNIAFTKTRSTLTGGVNINESKVQGYLTLFIGPTVSAGKSFLNNRLKINGGSTYNQVFVNGNKSNEIFNHRLSAVFSPKLKEEKSGKFNFTLSANYIQKLKSTANAIAFSEFTGNFGLNYSF